VQRKTIPRIIYFKLASLGFWGETEIKTILSYIFSGMDLLMTRPIVGPSMVFDL